MASQEAVSELKVEQLKGLAAKHNVEVASSDKKEDLVKKVSAGITPEDLEAYKSEPKTGEGSEEATGNVAANGATDGDGTSENNQQISEPADTVDGVGRDHAPAGTSEGEVAAERAGVPKERSSDPKQNREPRNEFEVSNQKVTEEERQAAQKVSDMSTKDRVENSESPSEVATKDAANTASVNQGADIAAVLVQGLKDAKGGNFELKPDEGVEPRFSLVRNKEGKVLVRENETGHLSEIQLKSIEEKEASIQNQEVEEI